MKERFKDGKVYGPYILPEVKVIPSKQDKSRLISKKVNEGLNQAGKKYAIPYVMTAAGLGLPMPDDMLIGAGINKLKNLIIASRFNKIANPVQKLDLNLGWGPQQKIKVSRTDINDNPLQQIYKDRWDAVNENAPSNGIWWQGKLGLPRSIETGATKAKSDKALRARQLFSSRPVYRTTTLDYKKPLTTVGDVDRVAAQKLANELNADGVIFNDVYDNGYINNQVIINYTKEFNKPKSGHGINIFDLLK